MCYPVSYNNSVMLIICKEATRVSDQMASVLQSMQDYIEHHYLDEMMDEIEARALLRLTTAPISVWSCR